MEHIFERKIYQQILQWKQENQGKSALLVEGARRVGKSTIVEQFAQREYKSYILIDFNKASKKVLSLFDDLMDLDYIFLYLQGAYKTTLYPRESVIIFDEVQKCPLARQPLRPQRRMGLCLKGSMTLMTAQVGIHPATQTTSASKSPRESSSTAR